MFIECCLLGSSLIADYERIHFYKNLLVMKGINSKNY